MAGAAGRIGRAVIVDRKGDCAGVGGGECWERWVRNSAEPRLEPSKYRTARSRSVAEQHVAYHEAGHAVVALALGVVVTAHAWPYYFLVRSVILHLIQNNGLK